MQKIVHRYEQTAARLVVEGYPDLSDPVRKATPSGSCPAGDFNWWVRLNWREPASISKR